MEQEYERSLIPPDDTFFRWERYVNEHYEELRQATDDIYCEKSDLEFTLVPLEIFEGDDTDQVREQSKAWCRKYSSEFEADVYTAEFGKHNMLGPWSENRERRDFYNKNSEIIKRIIEQSEEDQKLGQKLMKKRAKKAKQKNIQEMGEDDPSLKNYMQTANTSLQEGGAQHVDKLNTDSRITPNKLKSMRTTEDSNKDELEVGYFNIRPQSRKGRRRRAGKTDTGKIHIQAEKDVPATKPMQAEEYHSHLATNKIKEYLHSEKK